MRDSNAFTLAYWDRRKSPGTLANTFVLTYVGGFALIDLVATFVIKPKMDWFLVGSGQRRWPDIYAYPDFWLSSEGHPVSLLMSLMWLNVLIVFYLWVSFRASRQTPYPSPKLFGESFFALCALLLMVVQYRLYQISNTALPELKLLIFPM